MRKNQWQCIEIWMKEEGKKNERATKNISKRRWLVLLFACLTNLCLGSVYAWSVFAAPMAEYLGTITGTGITTADLAIVYTVANSVGPITMISGGWINDRFGPKK